MRRKFIVRLWWAFIFSWFVVALCDLMVKIIELGEKHYGW